MIEMLFGLSPLFNHCCYYITTFNVLNQDDVRMQALFELNHSVFVRLGLGICFMLMPMSTRLRGAIIGVPHVSGCFMSRHWLNTCENHFVLCQHCQPSEKTASTLENCMFVCINMVCLCLKNNNDLQVCKR